MVASMKRSYSDTEDDVFSEADGLGSPSQSCQISDRKKRRGIIEKRRRDRINNSLAELRRLVPTAFEKQGSAKLEKAEILQMTVDHLKHLHSKAYNYHDPHSLSMDYRVIGFRECAAEVARYMVTAEGMDIQDPLRLRMMSHLQCYSAQREAACKLQQSAGSASWNLQASGLNSQYNTNTGSIGPMSLQHTQSDSNLAMSMSSHMPHVAAPHCSSTLTTVSCHDPRSTLSQNNNNEMTNLNLRLPTTGGSVTPQMSGTVSSTNISPHVPLLPTLPHGAGQVNTQLPGYSMPMLSPNGTHSNYSMANSMSSISQQHAANTAKPYRPWGGPEVAY